MNPLTLSDNWEGGFTDKQGRRWTHEPNKGWRLDDRPATFLTSRPTWQKRFRRVATRVSGRDLL
jgi:hypothetical protein